MRREEYINIINSKRNCDDNPMSGKFANNHYACNDEDLPERACLLYNHASMTKYF